MLERIRPIWLVLAMATSSLPACAPTDSRNSAQADDITEREAIAISRQAVRSAGYDLDRLELDTFGDRTGGGNTEWLIAYRCKGRPMVPGCSLGVAVDRKTGAATIHRGM